MVTSGRGAHRCPTSVPTFFQGVGKLVYKLISELSLRCRFESLQEVPLKVGKSYADSLCVTVGSIMNEA